MLLYFSWIFRAFSSRLLEVDDSDSGKSVSVSEMGGELAFEVWLELGEGVFFEKSLRDKTDQK